MMHFGADTMVGRTWRLALAMAATWLLALVPAVKSFGSDGLAALTFSALVCFVPGCVVFWIVAAAAPRAAQVRAVTIGTLLRMASALTGAYVMHQVLGFEPRNYLVWLGLCYLVALGVETCLLMPRARNPQPG
ncbi:MAG: hypothetical protein ACT4QC_09780 [Planctomycetaceae bacterium]